MAAASLVVRLSAQIAEFQQSFNEATTSVERFQKNATNAAKSVAGAFGVGLGVGALVSFGKSVLDAADNIVDLSYKTGLSKKAIQEMQYVAGQTGTTVDAFANAIFKLGTNLESGDAGAVAAVEALGLSFEGLKQLKPEDQFEQIAAALGRLEDPQKRNTLAVELFGKAAKEILPAVAEGYAKLAAEANIATDAQIKSLAEANDAISRTTSQFKNLATQGLGTFIQWIEKADKASLEFFQNQNKQAGGSLVDNWKKMDAAVMDLADSLNLVLKLIGLINVTPVKPPQAPGAPTLPRGAAVPYNPVKVGALDYKKLEASLDASIKKQNASWDSAGTAATAAMDKAKAAADAYTASVKALADELSGGGLQADVKKLEDAFRLLTDEQKKQPDILNRAGEAAEKLRQDGARLSPELQLLAFKTKEFSEWLNKIDGQKDVFAKQFDALRNALPGFLIPLKDVQVTLDEIENSRAFAKLRDALPLAALQDVQVALGQITDAKWAKRWETLWKSLEDTARQAAGNLASVLGEGIRTGDWSQFENQFKDILSTAMGQGLASAVNFLVPGLGSILEPIFSALSDKLLGALGLGTKGRDLVKEFADSMGGFDALRERLNSLGDAGETLWKRLTQGVGKNNPTEAAAAIDAINAALGRQGEFIAELTSIYAPKLEALYESARGSGELLSESMIPYIEQARAAGVITDELAEKLLGLTTDNSANWREMQSLAETYGIELGALGATFQQQKLTDTASQIIRDFDMLIRNGADFNGVLAGMKDEINQVVLDSLKFGTDIPENMRPWIQALIDTGLLIDGTGEKITGIDRLKFGPAIKSDIQELNDTIRLLIDALTKGVGGAIDTLNTRRVRIPVRYEVENAELNPGAGSFRSGGATQTINVNLDGDVLTRAVVRNMPSELELNGI